MFKVNKQLQALIKWALKYMDSETTLNTTIDNFKVTLKTENVFNQIHLIIKINEESLNFYYYYDFYKGKWFKESLY